ncbi:LANO_0E14356g1_1 [Lachancea nothofagi CBS 11611]|uniref:LANO_0E14356g1_1 n=1 Tax=Lachancea nothofagi CBS 11611 TaxID=1266666 RepID=A0A1G4JZW7_9SACH|nr:LANO_0E14356g1_1 [Lachancea nothofagi CBS 11611]
MFAREARKIIPNELHLGTNSCLEISAVHFSNNIVLQIRFNGELDTCLEVNWKGIPADSIGNTPLGSKTLHQDQFESNSKDLDDEDSDSDFEDYKPMEDVLSNFHIATRLGDSNDMKLPIVCSQIAELYQKVVFPSNVDKLRDISLTRGFVISLSAKMWRRESSEKDFAVLLFILQTIKDMYT